MVVGRVDWAVGGGVAGLTDTGAAGGVGATGALASVDLTRDYSTL